MIAIRNNRLLRLAPRKPCKFAVQSQFYFNLKYPNQGDCIMRHMFNTCCTVVALATSALFGCAVGPDSADDTDNVGATTAALVGTGTTCPPNPEHCTEGNHFDTKLCACVPDGTGPGPGTGTGFVGSRDLDVVRHSVGRQRVPRRGEPIVLRGQAASDRAVDAINLVCAHEYLDPRTPLVVSGSGAVVTENLGSLAEQAGGVWDVDERGNHICIEGLGERKTGFESGACHLVNAIGSRPCVNGLSVSRQSWSSYSRR